MPDDRLPAYAGQLLILAARALRERATETVALTDEVVATAVPTACTANVHERREAASQAVRSMTRPGFFVSVSHARGVSLLLATPPDSERFGVDLERTTPERLRLAKRIRSTMETETLGDQVPWGELLRCICAKEAAFKVLPAEEQVGLTFRQLAVVPPDPSGLMTVRRVSDGRVLAAAFAVADADLLIAVARRVLDE